MTENIRPAQGARQAALQLDTAITPEFIDALELELQQMLYHRFIAMHQCLIPVKTVTFLMLVIKYLSLAGLGLTALSFISGGLHAPGGGLNVAFFLFFALMLFVSWNGGKMSDRLVALRKKLFNPYWVRLANYAAKRMLKAARKLVPFDSQYTFHGDVACYRRSGQAGSIAVWERQLRHFYLPGQRVSLLFKRKRSFYSYAIVLHERSDELAAYLNGRGLQRIV